MATRGHLGGSILTDLDARLERARARKAGLGRPFVTLAYAQSLDGSIASRNERPLALSCRSSWQLTHELRASHDAILVGIGTVLADDPRLNVRLVPGEDPQPVVVDSRLRLPHDALLLSESRRPWIATTEESDVAAGRELAARGAEVLRVASLDNGWVDLAALAGTMAGRGVRSMLVEGGSRILASFLRARLVDFVVLTVAPRFVGGQAALAGDELSDFPRLVDWRCERCGDDLVLAGEIVWPDETRTS